MITQNLAKFAIPFCTYQHLIIRVYPSFTFSHVVPGVVPPGRQTGLSGGGVAGVVIAMFIVIILLLVTLSVGVLFIMWRRKQTKSEDYAVFE